MPEIGNNIAQADINLVDETFDGSQSASYHLSLQTEPDRLSYCVFNTVIHKCIVLRSYPFSHADAGAVVNACRSVFENDELLRLNYKRCCHIWVSQRCTLFPEHLFAAEEAERYLTFNQGALTGEQTLNHFSRLTNVQHLFSCPEELIRLLRLYHPSILLLHHSTPFIESVIAGSATNKTSVAIYFYSGLLDILVVKNKQLLFYNSFQINAPADSVYYLVGVSNMFNVELLTTKIMYAGNLKQMPPEIAILKDYTGQMTECEPPTAVIYSHYLTDSFRKNFINLFNSYECE